MSLLHKILGLPTEKYERERLEYIGNKKFNLVPVTALPKTSGGWILHRQGKMTATTKYKVACDCGKKFVVTKKKNNRVYDINIHTGLEGDESKYSKAIFQTHKGDRVHQYISICPNCSNEKELFCEVYDTYEVTAEYCNFWDM